MKIPCMAIQQGKEKFWLCKVKVKDIVGKCLVDQQSPENSKGYQRETARGRGEVFGRFIQRGGYSPVNLLINIRNGKITEKDGYLEMPDNLDWWIVDGQHRFHGLKTISEEDPNLREVEIPIAMLNTNQITEAKQFLIINKYQKGVRTDLAERILYNLEKEEGTEKVMAQNLPIDIWKSEALKIVDILTDTSESPLYKLIKRPGEKGKQPLKQVSVTDSLEPVIKMYGGYLKSEKLAAKGLMNMWGAIKEICPEAFSMPKEYLLLKTPGIFVLNRLFAHLLPTLWTAKDRDLTKGMFYKLFTHTAVKDYFSCDYWHTKNDDGASKFGTSRKSYNMIFTLISGAMDSVLSDIAPDEGTFKM